MTDFSNRDIDATMSRLEAAATATPLDVPRLEVRRVLLALDGSNQDQVILKLSRALIDRLGCPVLLTYAYEQAIADAEKDRYLAEQAAALAAGGIETAHARGQSGSRASRQILELAEAYSCDLLVLPSPYLKDFQDLGRASVGTTTDILLHQRATPLLIVRKPAENVRNRLENVVLPSYVGTECRGRGMGAQAGSREWDDLPARRWRGVRREDSLSSLAPGTRLVSLFIPAALLPESSIASSL